MLKKKNNKGSSEHTDAQGSPASDAPAKSPPRGKKSQFQLLIGDIFYLLLKIAIIVVAIIVVMTYVFGITAMRDTSMDPAVKDGDLVVFYRLDKHYAAQDAIVLNINGESQVRRVIAVEGDEVNITDQGLLINGYLQQEPTIYEDTMPYDGGIKYPVLLQPGQVFVMGDKRTNAIDSRLYGCVNVDDTLGKVFTIIRKRGI